MDLISEYQDFPIFHGLSDLQIGRLSNYLVARKLSAGETVFYQGMEASHLYILLRGKVTVRYKPYDGPVITIANIIPGWIFGWSAALGRQTYTSAAISLCESSAFSISKEDLQKICMLNDDTGIIFFNRLIRVMSDRLNQTHSTLLSTAPGVRDRKY